MIEYNVYPGGKRRIVTFSYDDGSETDARLIELFNKYGVKSTFHLTGRFAKCVCHLQSSPGSKDVEAKAPWMPNSSFLACISSATAFNVSKFVISSALATTAPSVAQ